MVDSMNGLCIGDRVIISGSGGDFGTPCSWMGERGRIIFFDTDDDSAVVFFDSNIGRWGLVELDEPYTRVERIQGGLTMGWFTENELKKERCSWISVENLSLFCTPIEWID
jgi:hypothetical protein